GLPFGVGLPLVAVQDVGDGGGRGAHAVDHVDVAAVELDRVAVSPPLEVEVRLEHAGAAAVLGDQRGQVEAEWLVVHGIGHYEVTAGLPVGGPAVVPVDLAHRPVRVELVEFQVGLHGREVRAAVRDGRAGIGTVRAGGDHKGSGRVDAGRVVPRGP